MSKVVDTIVIGGGQAGLASGYHLQKAGLDFMILEAGDQPAGLGHNIMIALSCFLLHDIRHYQVSLSQKIQTSTRYVMRSSPIYVYTLRSSNSH